ncbi:MAG: ATP-binding cassette domain-containing protein [Sphaerochaetaceae bacterium]
MGLVCSQIEVNYPEFKLSLDLKVAKGELVSIIGPSGCGKSTSLQTHHRPHSNRKWFNYIK